MLESQGLRLETGMHGQLDPQLAAYTCLGGDRGRERGGGGKGGGVRGQAGGGGATARG